MPSILTKSLSFNAAEQFKESFSEETPTIAYISIGNHIEYSNESSPDPIVETISTDKLIWDNMFAGKRITGNDVQLVIPRYNWTSNVKYRAFDDTIEFSELFKSNNSQSLNPMYVMNSTRNVYKCVSNNNSAFSTVEPTGDYITSNGNVATADGYIWKYMFNVTPFNKFFINNWIPAPTNTSALDFNVSPLNVVDGELTSIIVTNPGTNYRQASNIKVNGFTSGQTTVKLSNTALVLEIFSIPSISNLTNMLISGSGIPPTTHIEDISIATGVLTLSSTTTGSGGNTNNIAISTRLFIDGPGSGGAANVTLSNTSSGVSAANAKVSKITVTSIGTGYTYANAVVYGSGTGATCRVILPPKYGHGFNPAKELNANNVMIAVTIGENDTTESGTISSNTSFRQVSLLRNPHKYGESVASNNSTSNSVFSQTTDLNLIAGTSFNLNEYVYQGNTSSPTAYGFVNDQTLNFVKLTKVKGTFSSGGIVTGFTSGATRTIVSVNNPEFQPYSGDFLYVTNELKTERTLGQAENIKIIINF